MISFDFQPAKPSFHTGSIPLSGTQFHSPGCDVNSLTTTGTKNRSGQFVPAFRQRNGPGRRSSGGGWPVHPSTATPFGITDYSTHLACVIRVGLLLAVLNAFRHHRLFHRPGRRTAVRRDVLNAFRHHRLFHALRKSPAKATACAQRLSASQTIPPISWCRTMRPIGSAQRLSASQTILPWSKPSISTSISCSTPFGITDYSTDMVLAFVWQSHVLNAFRHHRLFHDDPLTLVSLDTVCSTPFGITDYSTAPGVNELDPGVLCSTPFGITDYSTAVGFHSCRARSRVLNAFRHHRLFHGSRARGDPAAHVLNAFRHHRLFHATATG